MNWSEKEYNDYAKKMGIPLANAKLKEPLNTAKHQEALNKKGGGAIPHKQNNTKSKYSNKKVLIDGITFDSKKEAKRYTELKILESAGEIINLEVAPHAGAWIEIYSSVFYKSPTVSPLTQGRGLKLAPYYF